MSKAWPTKPLGELCNLINGRAFKPSDWGSEGLPIVRIQNLNDEKKPFNHYNGRVAPNHLIGTGEVLLSWSGTPGTSFGCFRWERGPGVLNQHIFKVIVDESQIDANFFIAAVNSRLEEMISKAHGGVGLRHITKSKLEAIHLPVPPLTEQRRVFARIKECTERVEEIEKLRTSSRLEAAALYKARAVDLLTSRIAESPKVKFESLVHATRLGLVRSRSEQSESNPIAYLRMQDLPGNGRINLDGLARVNASENEINLNSLMVGDFLFNTRNSAELVGKTAVVESLHEVTLFNNNLMRIRFLEGVDSRYINHLFQHEIVKIQLDLSKNNTTSVCAIYWKNLAKILIPFPSLLIQRELADHLDIALFQKEAIIAGINDSDASISHLRDAILRKAFAGEL